MPAADGSLIPLSDLVRISQGVENKTIYHKNLKNVTYVTGDVAGTERKSGLRHPEDEGTDRSR